MNEYWIIVLVVASFSLGYWIGHRKGFSDGQEKSILNNQRLEATKIWAETMAPYIGGKHGK